MTKQKMTTLQWAAIAAIRNQEAMCETYRFVNQERRLAERMVKNDLLRPKGNKFPGEYKVTAKGTRLFESGI